MSFLIRFTNVANPAESNDDWSSESNRGEWFSMRQDIVGSTVFNVFLIAVVVG